MKEGSGVTTNSIESWHNVIRSSLRANPTIDLFLHFIDEETRKTEAFIAQVSTQIQILNVTFRIGYFGLCQTVYHGKIHDQPKITFLL